MTSKNHQLRVGFILAPRFTLSAFSNFIDVLRLAADHGDRSRPVYCQWTVISSSMEPIRSSLGIALQPQARPVAPSDYDYIVVVGGLLSELERLDTNDIAFLHQAAAENIPLVGVCTGAFILQQVGLMDGYKCCVNWFHHDDFLEQFENIEPVANEIFVVDRDRLTCAGGASSANLAAYLVAKHLSVSAAEKSLGIMIVDRSIASDHPQPGFPVQLEAKDHLVKRALLIMQQNQKEPLPIPEIANMLCVSKRQLERRFQKDLSLSPRQADKTMRLLYAKHLILTRRLSVSQVAAETGFCDAAHFNRAFLSFEGLTPTRWLRQGAP
ncbi:MAG: GlxA family transcriptional regulator [Pseudomonadota bacterium]